MSVSEPLAQPLRLPDGYGQPAGTLQWEWVRRRLAQAAHYWLVTVRPDGRPHTMPVDGLWINDEAFFGGSSQTVKHQNLQAEPRASIHLEDASSAVVVEGVTDWLFPEPELALCMSNESKRKYGYAPPLESYTGQGVWRLRPLRVLAWDSFPKDATRFVFPGPIGG